MRPGRHQFDHAVEGSLNPSSWSRTRSRAEQRLQGWHRPCAAQHRPRQAIKWLPELQGRANPVKEVSRFAERAVERSNEAEMPLIVPVQVEAGAPLLVPVQVEAESPSPRQIAVVLVSGVRVEGLTVAEIAELLRRLS